MYDQITQAVTQYWIEEQRLPESMTPEQQQTFLETESERISSMIEQRVINDRDRTLEQHLRETGEPADYLTKVALLEQVRRSATETVLAEEVFGDLDPIDPFPPTGESAEQIEERDRARIQVHRTDPERWTTPLNCRDSDSSTTQLARHLWSERSAEYRMLASALLQARLDDGQAIPTSASDPLRASFTDQLDRAMVSTGRAARAGADGR